MIEVLITLMMHRMEVGLSPVVVSMVKAMSFSMIQSMVNHSIAHDVRWNYSTVLGMNGRRYKVPNSRIFSEIFGGSS
jgi:hypothetical protein